MYTVRFPTTVAGKPLVGPATQALGFRLSSTQGQVEMKFPLASGGATSGPTAPASPPPPPASR